MLKILKTRSFRWKLFSWPIQYSTFVNTMYSQNFTCSLLCNFAIILQEEAQLHVTNPLEDTEFQVKCQPVQLLRAASMLLPPTTGVANLELVITNPVLYYLALNIYVEHMFCCILSILSKHRHTYSIYTTHHTTIATARSHMRYLSAFSFLIFWIHFKIIIGKTACPSRWNRKLTVQIGKCYPPIHHSLTPFPHLGCVHCPHPHNNLVLMRHCGVNRVVMTVDCCEWKIGQSVSLDK